MQDLESQLVRALTCRSEGAEMVTVADIARVGNVTERLTTREDAPAPAASGARIMYSSGWPLRTSVSPARTWLKATINDWLRTHQVWEPFSVTSVGSMVGNTKYCGLTAAPGARVFLRLFAIDS